MQGQKQARTVRPALRRKVYDCKVCKHHDRRQIERHLIAGDSTRYLVTRFPGISRETFRKHRKVCMGRACAVERWTPELLEQGSADALRDLRRHVARIGEQCEAIGDRRTALSAVRELTRIIELLARISGELRDQTAVVVDLSVHVDERTRMLSCPKTVDEYDALIAELSVQREILWRETQPAELIASTKQGEGEACTQALPLTCEME